MSYLLCTDKKVYLNHKIYLIQLNDVFEMSAGCHTYNFEYQLSKSLPETITAALGSIEYKIDVFFKAPSLHKKSLSFKIERNDDWDDFPELNIPVQIGNDERFSGFCCNDGTVAMTVTLPQQGFSPGQVVPITILYVNKSSADVPLTKIELWHQTVYTTPIRTKVESVRVSITHTLGVKRATTISYTCSLRLPFILDASNFSYCRLISIQYVLHVEAISDMCFTGIVVKIPITIARFAVAPSVNIPRMPTPPPLLNNPDDLRNFFEI